MSTNCDPAVASLSGWFSYLVRPLAILVNKQFVLRAGLR